MEFYDQAKFARTIVVRLNPGDYVMESLRQVIRETEIQDGYIASGIASFDHCRLKTAINLNQPPVFVYPEWNDCPLEVVGIQGIIADTFPHVHIVVSDQNQAIAGHLEEARILFVGELVIQELVGQPYTREKISEYISQLTLKK